MRSLDTLVALNAASQPRSSANGRWIPAGGAGHNVAGHKAPASAFHPGWMSGPSRGQSRPDWARQAASNFHVSQLQHLSRPQLQNVAIKLGVARRSLSASKDPKDKQAVQSLSRFIEHTQTRLRSAT